MEDLTKDINKFFIERDEAEEAKKHEELINQFTGQMVFKDEQPKRVKKIQNFNPLNSNNLKKIAAALGAVIAIGSAVSTIDLVKEFTSFEKACAIEGIEANFGSFLTGDVEYHQRKEVDNKPYYVISNDIDVFRIMDDEYLITQSKLGLPLTEETEGAHYDKHFYEAYKFMVDNGEYDKSDYFEVYYDDTNKNISHR